MSRHNAFRRLALTLLITAALKPSQTWAQGCLQFDVLLPPCANFSDVNTGWCTNIEYPEHSDEIDAVYREATYCDNTPFVLVFEDDFNGTQLDQSKWRAVQEGPSGNLHVPQPANVHVSNGHLWLYAIHSPGTYSYYDWDQNPPLVSDHFEFTTSMVRSRYKYHEGWYEIKCRIPSDPDACGGTFPAFWAYGEDHDDGICSATEIDAFEYRGNDGNRWRMTTHYNTPEECGHRECAKCYEGGYPDDDLVYRLIWDRHNILWWRDDVGTKRNLPRWRVLETGAAVGCNTSAGYYQLNRSFPRARPVTHHALDIIANLSIDDRDNVERDPDAYPAAMVVDYIRYYRRVPCMGSVVLGTTDDLLSTFGEYNFITASSAMLTSSFSLASGQQLEVVARDFLDLDPGTTIANGADFVGRIGVSNCGVPPGLNDGGSAIIQNDPGTYDMPALRSLSYSDLNNTANQVEPTRIAASLAVHDLGRMKRIVWSKSIINNVAWLDVLDVMGNQVMSIVLESNALQYEIDTDHFAAGVYIVRLRHNNTVVAKQFVVTGSN